MKNYNETLKDVYSQVAEEVNNLYEYFRKKQGLEEEHDTERQLEILVAKKYISSTYISNLSLIVDYAQRERIAEYTSNLEAYKMRIRVFLEG